MATLFRPTAAPDVAATSRDPSHRSLGLHGRILLVALIGGLATSLDARRAQAAGEAAAAARQARLAIIISSLVALPLLVLLALRIAKAILDSVLWVRNSLRAMRSGDLTVPCVATTNDEVGDMARSAEDTRVAMQAIIGDVSPAASSVAAPSEELTATATAAELDHATNSASHQAGTARGSAQNMARNIDTVAQRAAELQTLVGRFTY
ncbi:methyl-accepting chemotaxis protein [Mobilicoccus pelagius]|uniref:Putative methyl-accepting chemotaxis protein n=1 Tax=Mobilicoccus pelagius NBRC 104925 TaxID=1089455 RepID=H5UP58_9MICO|nr:methyl-accepting chemotaxis protein [Mobilicoccus pelagius]GAB47516.1 putative methyl-accepting chemotaxis protein [Mobilicoccus pelagius NBRC 104925]